MNKRVVILGGGPNRIGQGIEFDYCCVHAAKALRKLGYTPIMLNSNPETVSTDYDVSDRLYFEPLTPEDVGNVLAQEKPLGVIAQLGGQTPLKLARALRNHPNFLPLGTSVDSIDESEDREKFSQILKQCNLKAPPSATANSVDEALAIARSMDYPLIVRPSFVLGGRAMRVVYSETSLKDYLAEAVQVSEGSPLLIERFLEQARELDVDAVSDGSELMMGAILEHIEQAGIHSGDSACVWPAQNLSDSLRKQVHEATKDLAKALNVKGLLNIQFAVKNDELFVIEVNPRASRTVPFVCKATGQPLMQIAVRVMLGESLSSIKASLPAMVQPNHVAVKAPVFPFIKFRESDPLLGPEMRSTGEVMGVDENFPLAYAKALSGAGHQLPARGQVFISVNQQDKPFVAPIAQRYASLGFQLLATEGTADVLETAGLTVRRLGKKHAGQISAEDLIQQGAIQLVINTPAGEAALSDDSYIRKAAVIHHVPMTTTLTGADAMASAIEALAKQEQGASVRSLQQLFNSPVPA